jgi:hypothetical protein
MKKSRMSKQEAKSPAKRRAKPTAPARRVKGPKASTAAVPASASIEDGDEKETATQRPDEMDGDLLEFVKAIDHYKREHRRQFPSWGEVLHVLKSLGFKRSA